MIFIYTQIDCPNYETSGGETDNKYDYNMVEFSQGEDYLTFDLMADAQGHIALSDIEDVHNAQNVYEMVIGGLDNTRVAIR